MADTPTDLSGSLLVSSTFLAVIDSLGNYALQSVPRVAGALVSPQNPMPVAPSIAPLAYSGGSTGTVSTTSGVLVTGGTYTRALFIQTLPGSTANVWLRPDGTAAASSTGIYLSANGGSVSFGTPAFPIPTGNITAITDGGAPQVVLMVGG